MSICRLTFEEVETLVTKMGWDEHPNARFAKSAHSLWFRFKNYTDMNAPYACKDLDGNITSVIMLTRLVREPYANLYEIFAVKPTYARELYWEVMSFLHENGVERLKMSCTPDSVGWHMGNGIVGWGVDPSGSIRVDVPIMPTLEAQLELREASLKDISLVLPSEKKVELLREEENSFGPIKIKKVDAAIAAVGKYYYRRFIL